MRGDVGGEVPPAVLPTPKLLAIEDPNAALIAPKVLPANVAAVRAKVATAELPAPALLALEDPNSALVAPEELPADVAEVGGLGALVKRAVEACEA